MNYYWLAEHKDKTERWAELQTNKEYLLAEIDKLFKEMNNIIDKAESVLPSYAINIYSNTMEERIKFLKSLVSIVLLEINEKEGGH